MAIAGSMTQTYTYELRGGSVVCTGSGTHQRRACMTPDEAAAAVMRGETVTVAGGDVGRFRELVTGKTARGECTQ